MVAKSDVFSEQELSSLKHELRLSYFTAASGFLIVMLVIQSLMYAADRSKILKLEILVITGTVILFYFLTTYFTRELRSEIRDGRKIIIFKLIEEKINYMDRQDRFSPETKKYVIHTNEQKYLVTEVQYKEAEVSDYLVIHMTPLSELIIRIEIVKKESLPGAY